MGGLISMFPWSLKKEKGPPSSSHKKEKIKERGNKRIDGLVKTLSHLLMKSA
jgi:hypothetical protein